MARLGRNAMCAVRERGKRNMRGITPDKSPKHSSMGGVKIGLSLLIVVGIASGCTQRQDRLTLREARLLLEKNTSGSSLASVPRARRLSATAASIVSEMKALKRDSEVSPAPVQETSYGDFPASDTVPSYPVTADEALSAGAQPSSLYAALTISSTEVLTYVETTKRDAAAIARALNEELSRVDMQLDGQMVDSKCSRLAFPPMRIATQKSAPDDVCVMLDTLYRQKAEANHTRCMAAVYATFRMKWASGEITPGLDASLVEQDGYERVQAAEGRGALLAQMLSKERVARIASEDLKDIRAMRKVKQASHKLRCE